MTHYTITARTLFIAVLFAACRPESARSGGVTATIDPIAPGTPIRFAGEIVLAGSLADESEGAIVVSVRAIGANGALLERSYEIADPAWLDRGTERTLPFGLDRADAIASPTPDFSGEMELVLQFDPDGNPATKEPQSVVRVQRVKTGDPSIEVVLRRADDSGVARTARNGPR